MSDLGPSGPPTPARPAASMTPLDYGRPMPARGWSRRDLILGLVICLLFSLGAGAITFAMIIVNGRVKDEIATILAIGVTAVVLALSLAGLMLLLRSSRGGGTE